MLLPLSSLPWPGLACLVTVWRTQTGTCNISYSKLGSEVDVEVVMWRTQTGTCNISYSKLGSEVDGGS